jgi:hypothetical protein
LQYIQIVKLFEYSFCKAAFLLKAGIVFGSDEGGVLYLKALQNLSRQEMKAKSVTCFYYIVDK